MKEFYYNLRANITLEVNRGNLKATDIYSCDAELTKDEINALTGLCKAFSNLDRKLFELGFISPQEYAKNSLIYLIMVNTLKGAKE